jgi:hypothetical protein
VVSVTVIVVPGVTVAGTVNVAIAKSGPTWTSRAATLLDSSVSTTALSASAAAIR